jgi:hypothetical protein
MHSIQSQVSKAPAKIDWYRIIIEYMDADEKAKAIPAL